MTVACTSSALVQVWPTACVMPAKWAAGYRPLSTHHPVNGDQAHERLPLMGSVITMLQCLPNEQKADMDPVRPRLGRGGLA